jgi:hypothetical protein
MASPPPRLRRAQCRRDLCRNWLALLALVALGIVWPGADTGAPEPPHAAPDVAAGHPQGAVEPLSGPC